ncbi:MAG: phospho-N-acetylmuramoyl-pentapeptide-transferase [Alphaproteobacteria bacterium PA2]|nr:MAG: phospho-N-acetylmuramoyl-pentapeptide-transferase [Alphaproteobacteria bacterium PA2]
MLTWIYANFGEVWGPLRLFNSFFFLAATGFALSALATWILLPKLWGHLPTDKGRAFAVNAELSVGKPVSAGLIFVSLFCLAALLFVPFGARCLYTVPIILAAMMVGYFDDRRGGFNEYQLAVFDLLIAGAAALVICGTQDAPIWLPGWKETLHLSPWLAIPLATGIIWISINATNCSDGVDGVSGSLAGTAIMILGGLLYAVIGNAVVADHLSIPVNREGANWAIMAFLMVGCLAGYLWYNAAPSLVLMGDAGSRPLGLLIGMLVVATNNPTFIVLTASVILLNGATGLFKVALLRFFGLKILGGIRFPLHDHCRKELGWSNTQVLVRFLMVQLALSALLVILVLKVR